MRPVPNKCLEKCQKPAGACGKAPPIRELCPAKEIIPASGQDGQGQLRTFHREAVCCLLGRRRRFKRRSKPAHALGKMVTLPLAASAAPAAVQVKAALKNHKREDRRLLDGEGRALLCQTRLKTLLSDAMTGLSRSVHLPCKASARGCLLKVPRTRGDAKQQLDLETVSEETDLIKEARKC